MCAVTFQPEYVPLLDGNINAALMLSQIMYWYSASMKTGDSKLRCVKPGPNSQPVWWLAKSHKDWEAECGLSRAKSRKGLKALIAAGIVEVETFKFSGAPTTHLRLLTHPGKPIFKKIPTAGELRSILEKNSTESVEPIESAAPTNPMAVDTQSITGNTQKITTNTQYAGAEQGTTLYKKKQQGELEMKHSKETAKTSNLAVIWEEVMGEWSDKYYKPLLGKERGQLAKIKEILQEQAEPVIRCVVKDWGRFAFNAMCDDGISTSPNEPNIGFLLAHLGTAKRLLDSKEKPLHLIAKKDDIVTVLGVNQNGHPDWWPTPPCERRSLQTNPRRTCCYLCKVQVAARDSNNGFVPFIASDGQGRALK